MAAIITRNNKEAETLTTAALLEEVSAELTSLQDMILKGNPLIVDTLRTALAAEVASSNYYKDAFEKLASGNVSDAQRSFKHADACHRYQVAITLQTGILQPGFMEEANVISLTPNSVLKTSILDHEARHNDAERARVEDQSLPQTTYSEFMRNVASLKEALASMSIDLKDGDEERNRAFNDMNGDNDTDDHQTAEGNAPVARNPTGRPLNIIRADDF